jgi:hypothetical protein
MVVQTDLRQELPRAIGRRVLAACIASAVACHTAHLDAVSASRVAQAPADTRFVTNCDDDGPGSLRSVLAEAANFDTISLAGLSCSLITLTTGELSTDLDNIAITGNATISGGGASRVLSHNGSGTLGLVGLEFTDGQVVGRPANGGCIYSKGNVALNFVVVRACHVFSIQGFTTSARGGGVYARGTASLDHSSILGNSILPAPGSYSYATGGGIHAYGDLRMDESVISGNVIGGSSFYAWGGGFFSRASSYIRYSTVSGNSAYIGGAGQFGNPQTVSVIRNSTISGNAGQFRTGGIVSNDGMLRVRNSTISFNTAQSSDEYPQGAGILALGDKEYLSLRSSIVAMNTAGGVEDDVCMNFSLNGLVGSANLIGAANVTLPHDTIQSDPMLAPLADNGGPTPTHALLPGSPAIDAGSNNLRLPYDQRGEGFPRESGNRADIGAFEVQQAGMPDGIFADGFE